MRICVSTANAMLMDEFGSFSFQFFPLGLLTNLSISTAPYPNSSISLSFARSAALISSASRINCVLFSERQLSRSVPPSS